MKYGESRCKLDVLKFGSECAETVLGALNERHLPGGEPTFGY